MYVLILLALLLPAAWLLISGVQRRKPLRAAGDGAAAAGRRAFDAYLDFMGQARFDEASRALGDLEKALDALSEAPAERRK